MGALLTYVYTLRTEDRMMALIEYIWIIPNVMISQKFYGTPSNTFWGPDFIESTLNQNGLSSDVKWEFKISQSENAMY